MFFIDNQRRTQNRSDKNILVKYNGFIFEMTDFFEQLDIFGDGAQINVHLSLRYFVFIRAKFDANTHCI